MKHIICSLTMAYSSFLSSIHLKKQFNCIIPNHPKSIKIYSPGLQDSDGFRTIHKWHHYLTWGLVQFLGFPRERAIEILHSEGLWQILDRLQQNATGSGSRQITPHIRSSYYIKDFIFFESIMSFVLVCFLEF